MNTPRAPSPIPSAVSVFWPFKRLYYGWALVGTALVATFASSPMYGPVLAVFVRPIGDDLGWSRATISLAFTLGSFGGSVFSALIGVLLDRYGPRGIVTAGGVIVAICMVGLAFMSEPWHFWVLFGAGRGIANSCIQLGVTVGLANWFIRKRGRALALGGVGLRAGQAVLPLIIHAIIVNYSWRHAYGALAGMTLLLVSVPAALFARRRPEDHGLLPDGDPASSPTPEPNAPVSQPQQEEESWTLREALRTQALWLLIVTVTGIGFAQTAVNLHAIASFQDRGISAGLAVAVGSIFAATSAVTSIGWGFLMERLHVRWATMMVTVIYALAMVVIMLADNFALALMFALLFGIAQGGWTVGMNLLFANYFGRRSLGAIRGFSSAITSVVGPLGAVLAGLSRDLTGSYVLTFALFAGVFSLAFVATFLAVPPKKPRQVTTG